MTFSRSALFPCLSFAITFSTLFIFFFFNDTATTEIYTLSLHDALPIYRRAAGGDGSTRSDMWHPPPGRAPARSEEHTSELQSHSDLVCRLLLEKKKRNSTVQMVERAGGLPRP